jgi:hypothetical protein
MELNGSLGASELGPIKHCQAQINGARIHANQFVLEPELSLPDFDLNPTPVEEFDKDMLIQLPRAVLVGISQGGMARSSNPQMFQLPLTASKPSAYLTEGMGPAQLAEEHRDKLVPTWESFRMTLCLSDRNQFLKLRTRKQLQQLAEYATKPVHS